MDSPEFRENYKKMLIDGWSQKLIDMSIPEVVFYPSNEDEIKEYVKAFEDKYQRKLKYRIDTLAYISLVAEETEK